MDEFIPGISASINDTLRSLGLFSPELILVAGFLTIILADLFLSKKARLLVFYLSLLTVTLSGYSTFSQLEVEPQALFSGMITVDRLSNVFKLIFCFINILSILFIHFNARLTSHPKGTGDLYSIFIAVHLGMNLMAMSSNLLMVYLSLEMVSVGSYLMVGYLSDDAKQTEAAMKYVLFGAVCSAIMLYGISLLYGFTGTLDMADPAFLSGLAQLPEIASALGIILVLAGIAFKLSLVPFHFWSPDVYQGAATPVTAFLSTGPKIAGFALLIKFLMVFRNEGSAGLDSSILGFEVILSSLAIASMVIGNFGAIWQNNVKRMLAYSSIGHTGFMIMALLVFSDNGFKALIFYMVVYVIMNLAAFLIADEVEERSGIDQVADYNGLGKGLPLLMVLFVIVLVSLTGIPPTAGFTAKFLVFSSAIEFYVQSGSVLVLTMIAVAAISTVVSLFYYFKIPLNAFLRSAAAPVSIRKSSAKTLLSAVLVILLFLLILFPSLIMQVL